MSRVAVIGSSGFVGTHVAERAERDGHEVIRLHAPRLTVAGSATEDAEVLARDLTGADVVVNCAGDPDASSADRSALDLANGVLPGVVGRAARQAGAKRYVHVSSAVVQGRRAVLDSTNAVDPFSPYAASKILGERTAHAHGPAETVVYRPPSVHAPGRRVTRQLARIARSPLSTVASPGDAPTPQTHIEDVASAIVFLATSPLLPPPVVHHPWQGHTTTSLLTALGGRPPRCLPRPFVTACLAGARLASKVVPRTAPYVRRIEMTWLGQGQASSWLTEAGWMPETTSETWMALAPDTREPTPHQSGGPA